jgi:hypothetical protein
MEQQKKRCIHKGCANGAMNGGLWVLLTLSVPSSSIPSKSLSTRRQHAFDHYDFLLPRDQLVGLLLDNSLDVEM